MVTYTDSHCHLAMSGDEADALLDEARAASVAGFVVPGTKGDDSENALAIARRHADVWAGVGFHPHEAKDFDEAAEARIAELAGDPRVVAVGEIGLDYHYDFSPRDAQRSAFVRQLDLARRLSKPAIIHNRESTDDLQQLLLGDEGRDVRGVLHSYTDTYEVAKRLIDAGWMISFSGIVTFRSADMLRDVARRLPHDRVLIETDTPYLAPVPHRGRENRPAWVVEVAAVLAGLWRVEPEYVAEVTRANFESLFGVGIAR